MKRFTLFVLAALLHTGSAVANDYRILSVNGSSVQINGVQAKVGDVFNDKASINWGQGEKQSVRIYDITRRRQLVMSSANGGRTGKVREFLSDNRHLSTKGITNDVKKQAVERVVEYSKLMQEFLGDMDKVENLELINSICDNNGNVSVINDLTTTRSKDIGNNSMSLQDYMMMVTNKYEHKVKAQYSGFKYVKTVTQPTPLPGFDAASFAFVNVNKVSDVQGTKITSRQSILVNTATMKISSTISEDYEDPQALYFEALEKFNEDDLDAALPLFEKIGALPRYAGRYRAKSMAGWIYTEQRQWQKAYALLDEASAAGDPLGSVLLASKILMRDDVPVKLRNTTRGMTLLQQVGDARDVEMPTMHLIAKAALFDTALDANTLEARLNLSGDMVEDIANTLTEDPLATDEFKLRGYILRAFGGTTAKDNETKQQALEYIKKAEALIPVVNMDEKDLNQMKLFSDIIKLTVLKNMGRIDESNDIMRTLYNKPYAAAMVATGLVANKEMTEQMKQQALELYRTAASNGNAFGAYVISLSQMYVPENVPGYMVDWVKQQANLRQDAPGWHDFLFYLIFNGKWQRDNKAWDTWNQTAIELGSTDAMEDRALFEAGGAEPSMKTDIPNATELMCRAADATQRNKFVKVITAHSLALSTEHEKQIPYQETETYKTLRKLDETGSGAAAWFLGIDCLIELNDTVQAENYFLKSRNAGFYPGLYSYACDLYAKGRVDEAYDLFKQLTSFRNSMVYSILGDIARDDYHDYKQAKKWYDTGRRLEKHYSCSAGESVLYENGWGVKKDLKLAKKLMNLAVQQYVVYELSGVEEDDKELIRLRAEEARLDSLIALEGSGSPSVDYMTRLNAVVDGSNSEDLRIELSQTVLTEVFASPKAVVKTVGSNGQTVVATETAEDFLLRLATLKTDKRLMEVASKKDGSGKLTELTVRME